MNTRMKIYKVASVTYHQPVILGKECGISWRSFGEYTRLGKL